MHTITDENILSSDEYFQYARDLETYHSVFYKIWDMGKPCFSDSLPTAAVEFDDSGEFCRFLFNKEFWNKLNTKERQFVICHESLHVILNHGKRISSIDKSNIEAANKALDIVVNHMLLRYFSFNLDEMPYLKNLLCLVENIFKNQDIDDDHNFEYYYGLLKDDKKDHPDSCSSSSGTVYSPLDDHKSLPSDDNVIQSIGKQLGDFLDESDVDLLNSIVESYDEATDESGGPGRGTVGGSTIITVNIAKVPVKKKWESVIKKWAKKNMKLSEKDEYQWIKPNRRFANIASRDLFLPTESEIEFIDKNKTKIDVWFFQDTSGSCLSFAERFFKSAKTLPTYRFNVKMHCFDTRVYETTLESGKLYGFGGTSFDIIENYIQYQIASNHVKYPDAVFVITDGYGNHVYPLHPSRWYWFLSSTYNVCIPKECNIYQLSQFE